MAGAPSECLIADDQRLLPVLRNLLSPIYGLSEQAFKKTVADKNKQYGLTIEFDPKYPINLKTIPTLRNMQP
ncbi:MAG: hypothetical protein LZF86_190469 [Nitrospira sp.]|nr:MAG: hypothetical protein LZF86_190469 [Nitrospira sp.]